MGHWPQTRRSARAIVSELMNKITSATAAKLAGCRAVGQGRFAATLLPRHGGLRRTRRNRAAMRAAAMRALRFASFDDERDSMADWLASRQPGEVQMAAVETLAS